MQRIHGGLFVDDVINCALDIASVSYYMNSQEPGRNVSACPEMQGIFSRPYGRDIQFKQFEENNWGSSH